MMTLDELEQAQAEINENAVAEIRHELRQNLYQVVVDWAGQISDTLGMAAYSAVNGRWDDIPRDIERGRITAAEAVGLIGKMLECRLITGRQYEWYKQKWLAGQADRAKRDNTLAALKSGCYLAELAGRLFLCDDRLPCYKRLVAVWILENLLAAGLVAEVEAGVWQAR